MLDALITGALVGLFALAGNVAGALIISHQLAQPAHGPAGTSPVRSADVAMGRLMTDPVLRDRG